MLKRRTTAYYVLTGSGFLLEYKDADPILHPDPTVALKLSDCDLGNAPSKSGKAGFTLRGKDSGKSLGRTHEWAFRTDSMEQAGIWWSKLEKFGGMAGGGEEGTDEEESPVSPSSVRSKEGVATTAGATAGATAAPTAGGAGHVHATTTSAAVPTATAAPVQTPAQAAATQAAR